MVGKYGDSTRPPEEADVWGAVEGTMAHENSHCIFKLTQR